MAPLKSKTAMVILLWSHFIVYATGIEMRRHDNNFETDTSINNNNNNNNNTSQPTEDVLRGSSSNSSEEYITVPPNCLRIQDYMNYIIASHLFLSLVSVVSNCLSLTVHRKKKQSVSTILVGLCFADITQGIIHVMVGTWDINFPHNTIIPIITMQKLGGFLGYTITRIIQIFFEYVAQTLNALICIDRFYVLSNSFGKPSVIQKHSRIFVITVYVVSFILTLLDGYGSSLQELKYAPYRCGNGNTSLGNVHGASPNAKIINGTNFSFNISSITPQDVSDHIQFTTRANDVTRMNNTTDKIIKWSGETVVPSQWFKQMAVASPLVTRCVLFCQLLLVIILNFATHIMLQWRTRQTQWLNQQQSNNVKYNFNLLIMTTIYILLALPMTSMILIGDMQRVGFYTLDPRQTLFVRLLMRLGACFDQLKNASDFIVFLVLSSVFRASLRASLCTTNASAFGSGSSVSKMKTPKSSLEFSSAQS